MTRFNPSFSNQRRWKSIQWNIFTARDNSQNAPKEWGRQRWAIRQGAACRGGFHGAPHLPYLLHTVHHLTHCPLLTHYPLSTTLPTVHYLPTTHCPPLAHYHYLFTPPCPPLAQPVNISENEYWTVYTLPYPYTLPTVQGSKFRRSSNTWCLPHNVNCVPHTSKLVRKTCGVYHVYVMLWPASRLLHFNHQQFFFLLPSVGPRYATRSTTLDVTSGADGEDKSIVSY